MWATHDVEKQIYVTSVDTSQTIQHDDLCIRSMRFTKQIFLKGFLLLWCWKHIFIVVFGQYPVAIVVKDSHSFDCVQRRLLELFSRFNFVIDKTTYIYIREQITEYLTEIVYSARVRLVILTDQKSRINVFSLLYLRQEVNWRKK